jgi:anti-anti-sigma factor
MSPLQILIENISDTLIMVTIIGQLDESNVDANAPQVYSALETLPEGGSLILNFSGLTYMNSKSIGYTTDWFNKVTEKGGMFIISEAPPNILDILTVVGLKQVIPFTESDTEAKEMVTNGKAVITSSDEEEEEILLDDEEVTETPEPEVALEPETIPEGELVKEAEVTETPEPEVALEPETIPEGEPVKEVEAEVTETPEPPEPEVALEPETTSEREPVKEVENTPEEETQEEEISFPWALLFLGGVFVFLLLAGIYFLI